MDHRAGGGNRRKTPSSPYRAVWRLVRSDSLRASCRGARRGPAIQFRRNSFHSCEQAATQAEAAPGALSASICHGGASVHGASAFCSVGGGGGRRFQRRAITLFGG